MKHPIVIFLLVFPFIFHGAALAVKGELGDPVDGDKHKHNFSKNNTTSGAIKAADNGTQDSTRICVFCHTPHGASADSTLWNRKAPIGPNGDGTFPLYGSPTQVLTDPSVQPLAQYGPSYGVYPNGASRLCMSCHDGVSAVGDVLNVGDSNISTGIEMAGGIDTIVERYGASATQKIDLSTSHPISFVYNSAVMDAINLADIFGGIYVLPSNPAIAPLDGQGRMQCTTCHDPHFDSKLANGGLPPMWRHRTGLPIDDVCTQCHNGSDWDGGGGSPAPVHP